MTVTPVLQAKSLSKKYGRVVAIDGADFELMPGEILAVIGDNGAGKSSLIRALSGALQPDSGEILLDGKPISFASPIEARHAGIETVYQTLALSPALSISDNMFLGREVHSKGFMGKYFRQLDRQTMDRVAREKLNELGLMTIQNIAQPVETLSGGQRQGIAVARAAAFGSKVIIMDEPTAALGVKESQKVLDLIKTVRARGVPIVLISHNMPRLRVGRPYPYPPARKTPRRGAPDAMFNVGCGRHDDGRCATPIGNTAVRALDRSGRPDRWVSLVTSACLKGVA